MTRTSKKSRKVVKWDVKSPTVINAIVGFLAQDFYSPKGFNDIYRYMHENRICSRNALWMYLEKLEKDRVLEKAKVGKRGKYRLLITSRKFIKSIFSPDLYVRRMRKATDRFIRRIEENKIPVDEITELIEYEFTSYERLLYQIFEQSVLNLKNDFDMTVYLGSKAWHSLIVNMFNLEIQLMCVFYKKYPEQTLSVIEKRKNKLKG